MIESKGFIELNHTDLENINGGHIGGDIVSEVKYGASRAWHSKIMQTIVHGFHVHGGTLRVYPKLGNGSYGIGFSFSR